MAESFAEIAIFGALERTLHYRIPLELREMIRLGARAIVPLGRREALGMVVCMQEEQPSASTEITFRSIAAVLDTSPVLPPDLLKLCQWISSYYLYPLGEVLQAALPSGIQSTPKTCFRLTRAGRDIHEVNIPSELLSLLSNRNKITLSEITNASASTNKIRAALKDLERKGLVERFFEWRAPQAGPKKVKQIRLIAAPGEERRQKSESLHGLVRLLEESGGALPLKVLRQKVKNLDYWVRKLKEEGALDIEETEEVRESHFAQTLFAPAPQALTPDQNEILKSVLPLIGKPAFQPFLLFGVTGSGKTEVYLQLVEKALEMGKGALVLVPEIAISTQMEALFRQRFGSRLAICHSALSSGSRQDQWRETLSGKRKIILGVRSAIFMPVSDLGLIIVDEEHDSSYKQDDHLRYHARDVALMRASLLQIPILLGSATPSLQSVHQCRSNRYKLISLPSRILDRPMPGLEIVDMRREARRNKVLSQPLQKALVETVEGGHQALIFLNRRGFATVFLCNTCGHVLQCEHCTVSLTYHRRDDRLRCHYCGWERTVPKRCPSCDHEALFSHGFGTERVEEEIKRLLPGEPIVRIDRDTVTHSRRMVECFNAIRQGKAKVVVGTQMVAKGHDFPNITLVGIINADAALQIPDFRAGETTVQLLMQVSGRAGRGEDPGRAILQTYNPSHYTIQSIVNMDYLGFCAKELESREELQYPPFTRLLRLLVTGPREETTKAAAYELAAICRETADQLRAQSRYVAILGPSPAPLMKLNRRFRWHLFAKAWINRDLQQFSETVLSRSKTAPMLRRVQLAVDRDPLASL